jgi:hypothetical protein
MNINDLDRKIVQIHGNPLDPPRENLESKEDKENFHLHKKRLLIVEILLFIYFGLFSTLSVLSVIKEIQIGSHMPVSHTTISVSCWIYGILGIFLMVVYLYLNVRDEDHNTEEITSSSLCMLSMVLVSLGLLINYSVSHGGDEGDSTTNFRRTIQVVISTYGFTSIIILCKGICRHFSIHKTVDSTGKVRNVSDKEDAIFTTQYESSPGEKFLLFVIITAFSTSIIVSMSIWFLILHVGTDVLPDFGTIFHTIVVSWSFVFLLDLASVITWKRSYCRYKPSFTNNMEIFFIGQMIYIVMILFMLLGYRYNYWSVPDDQFETPGITIPTLKSAYLNKISILMMTTIPYLGMGMGRSLHVIRTRWPVILHKYIRYEKKRERRSSRDGGEE